jgi:hypothetical protein
MWTGVAVIARRHFCQIPEKKRQEIFPDIPRHSDSASYKTEALAWQMHFNERYWKNQTQTLSSKTRDI